MAIDGVTPTLELVKPVVGDPDGEDLWGEKWNANADKIDQFAADVSTAVLEAPEDGQLYGRLNAGWVIVPSTAPDWDTIVNVPLEFPPEAHTHAQADVTDLVADLALKLEDSPSNGTIYGRQDAAWVEVDVAIDWTEVTGKPSTFPPTLPIPWADVSGKPSTFAPTLPIPWADVSGKPATFPPTVPIAWTDVSGKPSTFPPTVPIAQADITGLTAALAAKEATIAAGTTAQYWRGDKTWQTFPPAVGLVDVADTAPGSPVDKQLWWESDSGALYLRFNDGTTTQWVQVNASGPALPPSDGNEYVLVNGVWRLKKQFFLMPTTAVALTVTVPTWAKHGRFTCHVGNTAGTASSMVFRASVDGTTFLSGASDYAVGALIGSGSTATWSPVAAYSFGYISFQGNNNQLGHNFTMDFNLKRIGGGWPSYRVTAYAYDSTGGVASKDQVNIGWCAATAFASMPVGTAIKAIQFFPLIAGGVGASTDGWLDAEWS